MGDSSRKVLSFPRFSEINLAADELAALLEEADLGNPAAQFAVATAIDKGEQRLKGLDAHKYYHLAAAQGWPPAIAKLRIKRQ